MKRNSGIRGVGSLPTPVLGFSILVGGCRARTPESSAGSGETVAKEETTAVMVESQVAATVALSDGACTARFEADSSMFHMSEAMCNRGTSAVKGGKITLHVPPRSKRILNLFPGRAEDAKKDGAALLQPATDTVRFEDGSTQKVYGFDISVPALDMELPLVLVDTKGI